MEVHQANQNSELMSEAIQLGSPEGAIIEGI